MNIYVTEWIYEQIYFVSALSYPMCVRDGVQHSTKLCRYYIMVAGEFAQNNLLESLANCLTLLLWLTGVVFILRVSEWLVGLDLFIVYVSQHM